jgi:spore coat protein U-like protein
MQPNEAAGQKRMRSAFPRPLRALLFVLLAFAATWGAPLRNAQARSVGCYVNNFPTLAFGTVNTLSGGPYYASGRSQFGCTGIARRTTVYICLSVGTGTGGTTPTNRTLTAYNGTVGIQILSSTSSTTQIGNGTSYPMAGPYALSLGVYATGLYNVPLVIEIPTPQTSPPSSYYSTFQMADFTYYFATTPAASCPALISGTHSTVTGGMNITATVPVVCGVTATAMNFGIAANLASALSATSTLGVTCNAAATPVTVSLDNGATGTSPTARKMVSGTNSVTYVIYQNSAGTVPWGTGTAAESSTAGTTPVNLTAYGAVPVQATPASGTYVDVVNVTVSY